MRSMLPEVQRFLPVCRQDMERWNWDALDIILITGDAYVDHPSFGVALIGRWLQKEGWRVGIISQPDWRSPVDFEKLGQPRLFFGITAGNTDSLIANYTANKKPRETDDYSPGGRRGRRPDHAVIVYANRVREAFPGVPIVIGGLEASLRRLAHYDYWDDGVRRSILIDSRASILVYGMAERQIAEIARRLANGEPASELNNIRGTVVVRKAIPEDSTILPIPSYEQVSAEKKEFSRAFICIVENLCPQNGRPLAQQHGRQWVIQYPPALPLSTQELDALYELPYVRRPHPDYAAQGGIKAFETVRWSLTASRGCCGECSFCALAFHQGRIVQSRSADSLEREAQRLTQEPDFKGTITDVGGPTANLYTAACKQWNKNRFCRHKRCLIPQPCKSLRIDYDATIDLYRRLRRIPGVKHVFIGSGLRYDLLLQPQAEEYLRELSRHHISGLLKVAPEHCADEVLRYMNKPDFARYEEFVQLFRRISQEEGKQLYLVNYFISAHPGCSLGEALKLALYLAKRGVSPEQIQDFIPSPMTLATCMYYTGEEPFSGKPVYVARTFRERKLQRALIQYANPKNAALVREGLEKLGMEHVLPKLLPPAFRKTKGRRGHPPPPAAKTSSKRIFSIFRGKSVIGNR